MEESITDTVILDPCGDHLFAELAHATQQNDGPIRLEDRVVGLLWLGNDDGDGRLELYWPMRMLHA